VALVNDDGTIKAPADGTEGHDLLKLARLVGSRVRRGVNVDHVGGVAADKLCDDARERCFADTRRAH
jgi:hypothetical protein